jgi:hypothetical protein
MAQHWPPFHPGAVRFYRDIASNSGCSRPNELIGFGRAVITLFEILRRSIQL